MLMLPAIPAWNALHPLIVHFPIALLLVAPVFVLVGAALRPEKSRPFLLSALLLMVLGTAAAYVAVGTGEAAGRLAERSLVINATLATHQHLAERTRMIFTALTALFALIVLLPVGLNQRQRLVTTAMPLLFLALYGAGVFNLVNTAHNGGRLVHEFGVHAVMPQSPLPPGTASSPPHQAEAE